MQIRSRYERHFDLHARLGPDLPPVGLLYQLPKFQYIMWPGDVGLVRYMVGHQPPVLRLRVNGLLFVPLICTGGRRIPTASGTNHWTPEGQGDFIRKLLQCISLVSIKFSTFGLIFLTKIVLCSKFS